MSLPKQLNLPMLKQSAVAASTQQFACQPITGTEWAESSTISFDLAGCGARSTWLDTNGTWLELEIEVTSTANTNVVFTGFDIIKNLSLYASAGGVQLESISEYSCLHHCLRDLCSDKANILTSDTIMLNADPTITNTRMPLPVAQVAAAKNMYTFGFPLISIIGVLSAGQNYIPLFALNSPLRLDLSLHSAAHAIAADTATTLAYTVKKAILHQTLVSLSDIAQSQLVQMAGNNFSFASTRWTNHRSVHNATQTTDVLTIPARNDSCRSLLIAQRASSSFETRAAHGNLERIRNYLQEYTIRIGANFCTPKPVVCSTSYTQNATARGIPLRAYMECRRVFGSVTSESSPTLLKVGEYSNDVVSLTTPGSFLIGQELQPFSNVDKLISGTNTLASSIFVDLLYSSSCVACVLDAFVECDCVVQVDGNTGVCTVRF